MLTKITQLSKILESKTQEFIKFKDIKNILIEYFQDTKPLSKDTIINKNQNKDIKYIYKTWTNDYQRYNSLIYARTRRYY